MLTGDAITQAARIVWETWTNAGRIDRLPAACRPHDRADGYAIQAEVERLSGDGRVGWKIAATSVAGQRHIGVDGPLAGRLLQRRLAPPSSSLDLSANAMRVAEAEFAFRMAAPLPAREAPYTIDEVVAAAGTLHLAIEVPDSRYADFTIVGAPQLVADMACAWSVTIGGATTIDWRKHDLDRHAVAAFRNGRLAGDGCGANVGGPLHALTWLANEVRAYAGGLRAGDVIITGTCVPPVAIAPGDRVHMDFGELGSIDLSFTGS